MYVIVLCRRSVQKEWKYRSGISYTFVDRILTYILLPSPKLPRVWVEKIYPNGPIFDCSILFSNNTYFLSISSLELGQATMYKNDRNFLKFRNFYLANKENSKQHIYFEFSCSVDRFMLNFLVRKIKEWEFKKICCRSLPYFYTYPESKVASSKH